MHTSAKISNINPGTEHFNLWIDGVPRRLQRQVVYIIQMVGTNYIKVGSTSNPRSRITSFQVGTPFEIVSPYLLCPSVGICHVDVERFAQGILDPHRVRGEWFNTDLPNVISAIQKSHTDMGGVIK